MLPAIAQGAIGIERRMDDTRAADMLAAIHDRATGERLAAERAFLAHLDGSCETPIAGLAVLNGTDMRLRGEVLRPDGSEAIDDAVRCPIEHGPMRPVRWRKKCWRRPVQGFSTGVKDACLCVWLNSGRIFGMC